MNTPEFIYTVLLKPAFLKNSANWILKKIIPASISLHDARLFLNPNDPVISGALTFRVFESDEIKLFRHFFRPEMNFIDVGANIGLYTSLALSTPQFCGKVITIEPHNESRKYLEKNINANKKALSQHNIIISNMAVADFEGTAHLYKNPDNKGDNRLYADSLLAEIDTITVTTIDKICRDNNIHSIDIIKIDIQGAEGKAIRGAVDILGNSSDCILFSELWPYGLSQYGSDVNEYICLLQQLGFSLFKLGKNGALSPLIIDDILNNYQGRKYANIVGLKGKYLVQDSVRKIRTQ